MDYKQKYEEALERAKMYQGMTVLPAESMIETIFPELKESEDERIRGAIMHFISHTPTVPKGIINKEQMLAWLEKQGKRDARYKYLEKLLEADTIYQMAMNDAMVEEAKTKAMNALSELEIGKLLGIEKQVEHTDEEKVLIGARKDIALSIMNFLDRNTLGMDLSSMECADLESAVIDSDWSKVYDYMKKKLEKQGEKKYIDGLTQQEVMDIAVAKCFEQGEQKPILDFKAKDWYVSKVDGKIHNIYHSVDKVEPKFKVGDWVVFNNHHDSVYQVEKIENYEYTLKHFLGGSMSLSFSHEDMIRAWTIQDAKDGDVLVNGDEIVIFKKNSFNEKDLSGSMFVHCSLRNKRGYWYTIGGINPSNYVPATKEQRELLFQKMKESGYEWNPEKKELNKIHVIDEGKAEMDYCFTKMMNGEKVGSTWNEEDEGDLNNIIWLCNNCINGSEITWIPSQAIRIKSLIERIKDTIFLQSKQEWSEEDENILEDIEEAIINYWHGDIQDILLDWLKFLKQRIRG